jgi:adenylylsulfate kinase-like enzyme
MKNLTVTIAGESGSGKSTLTYEIKEFLLREGYSIEFDGGIDHKNHSVFNSDIGGDILERVRSIKSSTKITIQEKQTNRKLKRRK